MNIKSLFIGTAAFLGSLIGLNALTSKKTGGLKGTKAVMLNLPAAERNIGSDRVTPRWIVLHSTEGSGSGFPHQPSAKGVAMYFANPDIRDASGKPSPVSAQVIVDDDTIIRSVADNREAYAVGRANPWTLNIEICGFARWTREQWLEHSDTLSNAAMVVAAWCKKYNIPPVLLRPLNSLTVEGITTHMDVNAFYKGKNGNHGDPGNNFPYDTFLNMVQDILDGPEEYMLDV